MKSFLAAALFALARADCDSEDACDAQITCSFQMGPMDCSVPNVKQACCDIFTIGISCQGDTDCAQNAMMALPGAELQWMSNMPGGDMNAACPGLQQLNNDPGDFCTGNPPSESLLYGSLAIMTAKHYQPEKSPIHQVTKPVAKFASASPRGQFVNLATCSCLHHHPPGPTPHHPAYLGQSPCEAQTSRNYRAQVFWVNSDATVHHEFWTINNPDYNRDMILKLDDRFELPDNKMHATLEFSKNGEVREDLLFKVDAAPEAAHRLHLVSSWGGGQYAMKDVGFITYPAVAMDYKDEAQRFVFVCETCVHNVLPCQPTLV